MRSTLFELRKRAVRALVRLALKGDEVALGELLSSPEVLERWANEVPEVNELLKLLRSRAQ